MCHLRCFTCVDVFQTMEETFIGCKLPFDAKLTAWQKSMYGDELSSHNIDRSNPVGFLEDTGIVPFLLVSGRSDKNNKNNISHTHISHTDISHTNNSLTNNSLTNIYQNKTNHPPQKKNRRIQNQKDAQFNSLKRLTN